MSKRGRLNDFLVEIHKNEEFAAFVQLDKSDIVFSVGERRYLITEEEKSRLDAEGIRYAIVKDLRKENVNIRRSRI
jgi:hypothetical protein